MKQIKCESGLIGWQAHLRDNYNSFEEFKSYCQLYGLHLRLGFSTPKRAWTSNPLIKGSVNPSDYKKVKK